MAWSLCRIDFTDFTNSQNILPLSPSPCATPLSILLFSAVPSSSSPSSFSSSSSSSSSSWPHVSQDRRKSRDVLTAVCAPRYRKKRSVRFSITTVHAGGYADRKGGRTRGEGKGKEKEKDRVVKQGGRLLETQKEKRRERDKEERNWLTKRERKIGKGAETLLLLVGPH